jgi:hypothetical protein
MQFMDNGMFALTNNDGEMVIVEDKDRSNDDDVIFGAMSADGIPLMSAKTVDGLSINS